MLHSSNIKADVAVRAEGLNLAYGTATILKNIDLSLPKGQTLALLGPSGCGKTTLLRLVAGLLAPTKGSITINGVTVADAKTGSFIPPEKRHLGMVFQDYALWPHMTVFGNVSFPLEMRGFGRAEREKRVASALDRVGLSGFGERAISDMSGGQQQRVAIARAIVAEPGLVLFDEPLSNLDRELRENMVTEIGQLVANLGLTAIYVTHDQSEAFSLADQVAVMRAGVIEQLAAPRRLSQNRQHRKSQIFCGSAVSSRWSGVKTPTGLHAPRSTSPMALMRDRQRMSCCRRARFAACPSMKLQSRQRSCARSFAATVI